MDNFVIENNLLHSLFLFIGAIGVYKFFNIDELIDVRVTSRVISIFMCSTMLYGATWCLWYDDFTKVWNNVIFIGKFYTLFDSYLVASNYLKFKSMYWEILLHHIVFFCIFLNHELDVKSLATGLFVETSSILLNIGWFMIKAGWEKTLLFKINSAIIWITYLIFRVIGLTYIYYMSQVTIWIRVMVAPILLLNYYWFNKLTYKFIQLLENNHNLKNDADVD